MTGPQPSKGERIAALSALYQAERGDMSTLMGHALSLISIAVAYMVGVVAVVATKPQSIPAWVIPLLPLVVWAALGFHVMINANVFAKNSSVETLEDALTEVAFPTDVGLRYAVGNRAGRAVMEPAFDKDRWPLAVSTGLSYGGALGIVVVVTVYCVWQASCNVLWLSGIMGVVYLMCLVVILWGWRLFIIVGIDPELIQSWNRKLIQSWNQKPATG